MFAGEDLLAATRGRSMDANPYDDLSTDRPTGSSSAVEPTVTTREYRALIARLRWLRETAGLTQAQLAELIGEDQTTVSAIETGRRRVDIVELRTILHAIGGQALLYAAVVDAFAAMVDTPVDG